MKKLLIVISSGIFALGCGNAARPVAENVNTSTVASTPEKSQTAIAHSLENQQPPTDTDTAGKSKWKQSGDPIDTKAFDAALASAELNLRKKPDDAAAKKALSEAYYKRGVALTDARQYASALGDYRKSVKYDPGNKDAKDWIEKITMIYDSMNREAPKEGEEPPPLQLNKSN